MKPSKLDLDIYKGSTYRKGFQWLTSPDKTPMDLSGCSIKLQIRAYANSPDVLYEASTGNSRIEVTSTTQGKWRLIVSSSDSTSWTFNQAVYDLDITFPSGDVYTVVEGIVYAKQQVTRNA
jgi:hypothetical protein